MNSDKTASPSASRRIWIDRSRHEDKHRCARLRWLGYHAGSQHRGLQPVRKSIHLVLGGAVHAGLEVLLREGQRELAHIAQDMTHSDSIQMNLDVLFVTSRASGQVTFAKNIEDLAVAAALADLHESTRYGVELDDLERLETAQQQLAGAGQLSSAPRTETETPIVIEFDLEPVAPRQQQPAPAPVPEPAAPQATSVLDWSQPVYLDSKPGPATEADPPAGAADPRLVLLDAIPVISHVEANAQVATGIDNYLKLELAAQVEAMVRAYARRRWRPLLEQFEVLEVEREGEWKLGEVELETQEEWYCMHCMWVGAQPYYDGSTNEHCPQCKTNYAHSRLKTAELWFMSRHDALLRERQTGYLYLESFKTTGAWDRRREADAQVDMQGLSEAVDVEKRLGEAWGLLHEYDAAITNCNGTPVAYPVIANDIPRLENLVSERVGCWLRALPEPPRILGVRYEYLIKGQRRKDKSDPEQPGRYVADTPLIRAYKSDGLTADDRRWAAIYEWYDAGGKSKRLPWQTWKKAPVWRFMPVAAWIDLLDRGEVQPDCFDQNGVALDVLAEQFVPPVTVFRNDDDMRDMLQQLEAEEARVAIDVAAVQAVEHDPARLRSEMNQRFPQSRKACSYPGTCSMHRICYGGSEIRSNPEASELYQVRSVNHPQELAGLTLVVSGSNVANAQSDQQQPSNRSADHVSSSLSNSSRLT